MKFNKYMFLNIFGKNGDIMIRSFKICVTLYISKLLKILTSYILGVILTLCKQTDNACIVYYYVLPNTEE